MKESLGEQIMGRAFNPESAASLVQDILKESGYARDLDEIEHEMIERGKVFSRRALSDAASRLQTRGKVKRISQGYYIYIGEQDD